GEPVGLDQAAEGRTGAEEVLLAHHLVEGAGTEAGGERRLALEPGLEVGSEEVTGGVGHPPPARASASSRSRSTARTPPRIRSRTIASGSTRNDSGTPLTPKWRAMLPPGAVSMGHVPPSSVRNSFTACDESLNTTASTDASPA